MDNNEKVQIASSEANVIINSTDEIKRLGTTKNVLSANPNFCPSKGTQLSSAKPSSSGSVSETKSSPIVLNAQITKNYLRAMYGTPTAKVISQKNVSVTTKSVLETQSPFATTAKLTGPPNILNSKVCLPIRNVKDSIFKDNIVREKEILKCKLQELGRNVRNEEAINLDRHNKVILPMFETGIENDAVIDLDVSIEDNSENYDIVVISDSESYTTKAEVKKNEINRPYDNTTEIFDSDDGSKPFLKSPSENTELFVKPNKEETKKHINVISITSVNLPTVEIKNLVNKNDAWKSRYNFSTSKSNVSTNFEESPEMNITCKLSMASSSDKISNTTLENMSLVKPDVLDSRSSQKEIITFNVDKAIPSDEINNTESMNENKNDKLNSVTIISKINSNTDKHSSIDESQYTKKVQSVVSDRKTVQSQCITMSDKMEPINATEISSITTNTELKYKKKMTSSEIQIDILPPSDTQDIENIAMKNEVKNQAQHSVLEDNDLKIPEHDSPTKVIENTQGSLNNITTYPNQQNDTEINETEESIDDKLELSKINSCTDYTNAETVKNVSVTPIIKRKAGRPRKTPNIPISEKVEITEAQESFNTTNEELKKFTSHPEDVDPLMQDIDLEQSLNDSQMPVIKKKRGRPRKSFNSPTKDPLMQNSDLEQSLDDSHMPVIKKKRGRPRKISISLNQPSSTEITETQKSVDINLPLKSENIDSLIKDSDLEQSVNESPTPVIKKRGRPRKTSIPLNQLKDTDITEQLNNLNRQSESNLSDDIAIDNSVQIVKKRFRKKKIFHEYIVESESNDDKHEYFTATEETEETPIMIPKKRGRGRPKKQSVDPIASVEDSLKILDQETELMKKTLKESRSGRKRKEVDYFAMENSLYEFEKSNLNERSYSFDSSDEFKPKIVTKKGKHKTYPSSLTKRTTVKKEEVSSSDDEPLIKLQSESMGVEAETSIGSLDDSGIVQSEEITDDPKLHETTSNTTRQQKKKRAKYSRSGQTTEMMKSVFSAAMKQLRNDDVKDNTDSPSFARSVGRPVKNDEHFYLDDENRVICMTCEETIPLNDWANHNLTEHYNLSWRKGESPVNLDDKVSHNALKLALEKLKQLSCKRCSRTFNLVTDYLSHISECSGIIVKGMVKCAICKEEMHRQNWNYHKLRKHNNLAWRVGDIPLDLNDQTLVMSILKDLCVKKKVLYCYKCDASKKSIVGFFSHQAQCGKDIEEVKIACKICYKMVLPVSMPMHMKMLHDKCKEPKPKVGNDIFEIGGKRKAAQKARRIIGVFSEDALKQELSKHYIKQNSFYAEDFFEEVLNEELVDSQTIKCKFKDCNHSTEHVASLLGHMSTCDYKPEQYYICKNCLMVSITEMEMKDHVIVHINKADENQEYICNESDDDEENTLNQQILKKRKLDEKHLAKDPNFKPKPSCLLNMPRKRMGFLFSHAFDYTLQFCCNEYSTESHIFSSFNYTRKDWCLVNNTDVDKYLPKHEKSCRVGRTTCSSSETDHKFRTFELFEVEEDGSYITIFCGGPVNALAWLPTPYIYVQCNQVLAVAVRNCFDEIYKINMNYSEPTAIQFWNFGILKNKMEIPQPKLMFCLALNIGPIWYLEWCPSGCYSQKRDEGENMQRIGLLAVAGSVPEVHVYAVPFLEDDQMEMVYKVKPVLKLQLSEDVENVKNKYYPTRISWSKASGHKYIAIGYTNGMVGIFDLECSSSLRFKSKDMVDVILPYKTIKAHKFYITVLSMIHLRGGDSWLLTGSFDRQISTWDLKNNTCISYNRLRAPIEGTWMTNWICHITGSDAATTSSRTVSTIISSHRQFLYEPCWITTSNSTITSISTSDWLNAIIQSSASGDIVSIFPHQMLFSLDSEKDHKNFRYLLASTKIVDSAKLDNNGDSMNEYNVGKLSTMKYQGMTQKYSLLFCDKETTLFNKLYKQEPTQLSNYDLSDSIHLYPINLVNKTSFNPNFQASLYYAAGYQAGFVRLSYLKCFENDPQVK